MNMHTSVFFSVIYLFSSKPQLLTDVFNYSPYLMSCTNYVPGLLTLCHRDVVQSVAALLTHRKGRPKYVRGALFNICSLSKIKNIINLHWLQVGFFLYKVPLLVCVCCVIVALSALSAPAHVTYTFRVKCLILPFPHSCRWHGQHVRQELPNSGFINQHTPSSNSICFAGTELKTLERTTLYLLYFCHWGNDTKY